MKDTYHATFIEAGWAMTERENEFLDIIRIQLIALERSAQVHEHTADLLEHLAISHREAARKCRKAGQE